MHRTRTSAPLLAVLFVSAALSACGAQAPVGELVPARGVPGFDTRDYPGDAVMRSWFTASPYRWVGYYLPAPCYTGTTWTGRRGSLRDIGYGFAVIYVGEQDWASMRAVAGDEVVATEGARCSSANLTVAEGTAHAAAARAAAAADGFPNGTVIYLDVERVERVSPALAAYVRAWFTAMLSDGRYLPGLYAHDHNVPELYAILSEEYVRRPGAARPPLWVARQAGFDVRRSPVESGYPVATIWQGQFNVREAWAGASLNIDVNVADSADPSRGR